MFFFNFKQAFSIRVEKSQLSYYLHHIEEITHFYQTFLYKKAQLQQFKSEELIWEARVNGVDENGNLILTKTDGSILHLKHGEAEWFWDTP